jgi:hypothetical protein
MVITFQLHNLYSPPSIIRMIKSRKMRWAGHVTRMECKILVGKPEEKRPLGRPRHRWVDSIKLDLREIEWVDVAQDRDQWRALVDMVLNIRVP